MYTITPRGLIGLVITPIAAAGIMASALGVSAVAHASVIPGVDTHKSGMVLSREYLAQQKQEHAKAASAMDKQERQEERQTDSPAEQERNEIKGNLKAEEVKEAALKTVEELQNAQPQQPKAHAYKLKNPIRMAPGLMRAGWSQVAR